jgi:hypothetical protein
MELEFANTVRFIGTVLVEFFVQQHALFDQYPGTGVRKHGSVERLPRYGSSKNLRSQKLLVHVKNNVSNTRQKRSICLSSE